MKKNFAIDFNSLYWIWYNNLKNKTWMLEIRIEESKMYCLRFSSWRISDLYWSKHDTMFVDPRPVNNIVWKSKTVQCQFIRWEHSILLDFLPGKVTSYLINV